jgi:hypothetical protein
MQGASAIPDKKRKISKKLAALLDSRFTKFLYKPTAEKSAFNDRLRKFKTLEGILPSIDLKKKSYTLDDIPQIPTILLTDDQAADLAKTITYLRTQYGQFGGVKLIMPEKYTPQLKLNTDLNLFIRQQKLEDLPKGKPFVNIFDAYEFDEFKQVLNEFQDEYEWKNKLLSDSREDFYLRNEGEFWDIVHGKIVPEPNADDDEFIIEYAADLPLDKWAKYDVDPFTDNS